MGSNSQPVLILGERADRQCIGSSRIGGQGSLFTVYQHPGLPGISAIDVRGNGTIQCNQDLFVVTRYPNPHLHTICNTTSGWKPVSTITEGQTGLLAACSPTISLEYPAVGSFLKQGLPLWIGTPIFTASWIGMRRWAEDSKSSLGLFFLTRPGIVIGVILMVAGAIDLWKGPKD